MSGQVRLRWSNHQSTMMSMMDSLLEAETMVDVTLACEGRLIHAHRLVISACSPYFQSLLSLKGRHLDPIIFLKDVKYSELKALVQFIYRGEVNISQDDLPSFLTLAQELQIRGLAEQCSSGSSSPSSRPRSKIPEVIKNAVFSKGNSDLGSTGSKLQPRSTTSSPPPLKKVRAAHAQIPQLAPRSNNSPAPNVPEETLPNPLHSDLTNNTTDDSTAQSETELEGDELDIQPIQLFDDKDGQEVDFGIDEEGFTHSDWKDVLEEDENSAGQFCLTDTDGWPIDETEPIDMGPDDDDEVSGVSNYSRGPGGGGDNEPSLCPLCKKQFQKRKTWNTHMLYDCPMVPPKYSCPNCDYRARRGYQLKIHCLKIHGIVT